MDNYHKVLFLYAYFFDDFQIKNIFQKNSKSVKNVHLMSLIDVFSSLSI